MLMHDLVFRGAERQPEKTAFTWIDRGRSLTYAEAATEIEAFAGALRHLGIRPGDRVTIFAHNGLDYLVAMFGTWRIGAISALVNVRFAGELDYYFGDHTPAAVIYTHDMHAPVAAAAAKAGVRHLVCMDGPQPGAHSLPELLAARLPPPADPRDEDAIAHLAYTSGTTGKPKGACLKHEPTVRACRCIGERLRITAADRSFGPTALSSSYQLVGNLLPQLDRMASTSVMGRWTQTAGWDALDAAGATMLIANPPILTEVLAESRIRGRVPGALRLSLSGGGPVPRELKAGWRDELGLPLVESYGQSELGGFFALGLPELEPDDRRLMRIGPPPPDREVSIVTPDDRPAPAGAVGEIVLDRGGFMAGYWGLPDKTEEATRGGRLRSGDLGLFDDDGYLVMRGRRSELITVGGTVWFPRDVEEALARQPGIAQAALVGVADSLLGEVPRAFVVLEPGVTLDAAALKRAIAGDVAYDLEPLAITALEALPMTPTGKVAKVELAEMLREKAA